MYGYRAAYREPVECDNDEHEGNGIMGDRITACHECEEEAQDAYDDYMEQMWSDRELERDDYDD
jgi:hypothetical protein